MEPKYTTYRQVDRPLIRMVCIALEIDARSAELRLGEGVFSVQAKIRQAEQSEIIQFDSGETIFKRVDPFNGVETTTIVSADNSVSKSEKDWSQRAGTTVGESRPIEIAPHKVAGEAKKVREIAARVKGLTGRF